jgi:ERCC4-related helicase
MALRQNPVRLLIADDVGIGKTVEAGLIARELMDRGEIRRMAVLCPPALAEQWQGELREKFHIEAELVLASTATRLERHCRVGQSLFDYFPHVIVSTDFIKSSRRMDEFLRTCPEMVIVDEAHTCAFSGEGKGARHQRHRLVSRLAKDPDRHLILVTATPHSGKEEAFRSLLTLLKDDFSNLPEDLSGPKNEAHRRRLAEHFVQRKRGDIRLYLGAETVFPDRTDGEVSYFLSPEYKSLFTRALKYARETVADATGTKFQQRVRWWSALALLRALASSPAAASATLRNRAAVADTETLVEADEVGKRTVLDLMDDEAQEGIDLAPGCDTEAGENPNRRRLLQMARDADTLRGKGDFKLQEAAKIVKKLLDDGFHPIVFCRFIQTAEYVAESFRTLLPKSVEIAAVTGTLPPPEREMRVLQLSSAPSRVLVCTDCLSEGINLQEHFDAILHYDLSWNPTRHEQREGRVDRYGQPSPKIQVVTLFGRDTQIDGIVLDVLIRKHRTIRSSLGVSVPVPVETDQVVEAIFEGLLLKETAVEAETAHQQMVLPGFEKFIKPKKDVLYKLWDRAADREKQSRTLFAQHSIKVEAVEEELQAVRQVIGSGVDVERFTREALKAHGAFIEGQGALRVDLSDPSFPQGLTDALGTPGPFTARFSLPIRDGEIYLNRTHPLVEGLAGYVMETAFDPLLKGVAKRCGVMRTSAVSIRTTLLLVRFRYHIVMETASRNDVRTLLAEDCLLLGFQSSPTQAKWIDPASAEGLLQAVPEDNVFPDEAAEHLQRILDSFDVLMPALEAVAAARGEELLQAHTRVRKASQIKGVKHRVEPHLPPDILGVYVCLPMKRAL